MTMVYQGILWSLIVEMAWLRNGRKIMILPDPGLQYGGRNLETDLEFYRLFWYRMSLDLGLTYQQNSNSYTHVLKYAVPNGVIVNTEHRHPTRGNPHWWHRTWKSWNIIMILNMNVTHLNDSSGDSYVFWGCPVEKWH